ncbi:MULTISPECIES: putative hemolysin [Klebsiella]|jgi:putative hemolysin|uniref:DUF333 domain-containing protein n=2 Tax=Klebsiella aerogenes TaxID=548 RepID=A0AAJ5IMV6_KLEAE|nr:MULTISPECIES: DUF333 domain-containing protein [Klebsiella]MCL6718827.1 DUF333 domain-containing protein [Klebsiella sp. T2.Ur]DAF33087.1 MAG TPA: Putative hemolysin [Caudoviricetes sp.]AKK79936.1 hemolysin [Klebsiella aerogenes]AMH08230.1 DUF333 domain-containing protein [Klebsiella aerogenes]AML34815.1 hypothetical protein EAG7_01069 [Klebsiella aerogenes]
MKWIVMMLPLMLAGCAQSQQPDAPPPPNSIGMANPAAVYCDQKGGKQVPVQTPQGVRTDCKLPSGETLDEWELWRRDHPAKK